MYRIEGSPPLVCVCVYKSYWDILVVSTATIYQKNPHFKNIGKNLRSVEQFYLFTFLILQKKQLYFKNIAGLTAQLKCKEIGS